MARKVIRFWSDGTWIEEENYTEEGYSWKKEFFEVCVASDASDSEIDSEIHGLLQ